MYDILKSMEEKAFNKSLEKNVQTEQERLEQALSRKVVRLKKLRDLYKQQLAQVCMRSLFQLYIKLRSLRAQWSVGESCVSTVYLLYYVSFLHSTLYTMCNFRLQLYVTSFSKYENVQLHVTCMHTCHRSSCLMLLHSVGTPNIVSVISCVCARTCLW